MRNKPDRDFQRTIDHEPLSKDASAPVFGKRQKTMAGESVTRDFFNRTSTVKPARKISNNANWQDEIAGKSLYERLRDMDWPLKYIAMTLLLAAALPAGLIKLSEQIPAWLHNDTIDTMTTASVPGTSAIEINDVSMTRILRNNSSVVSVYGKISNVSGKDKAMKPLLVTLYDKNGKAVQSWQHKIPKNQINAKQNFRFITSAIDYSGDARTVSVTPVQ